MKGSYILYIKTCQIRHDDKLGKCSGLLNTHNKKYDSCIIFGGHILFVVYSKRCISAIAMSKFKV